MSNDAHVNDDVLERYAMRSLSEEEAESVEDHIALCAFCLDRLDETTAYINSMRTALAVPPPDPVRQSLIPLGLRHGWRIPAWGGGALAAATLVFMVIRPGALPAPAMVVLDGTRGVSTVVHGTGPFDFELFMPVEAASYHVELLDEGGSKQWTGEVSGQRGKLHAIVKQKIAAGQYFVQVTDPASGSRREYAVRVEN